MGGGCTTAGEASIQPKQWAMAVGARRMLSACIRRRLAPQETSGAFSASRTWTRARAAGGGVAGGAIVGGLGDEAEARRGRGGWKGDKGVGAAEGRAVLLVLVLAAAKTTILRAGAILDEGAKLTRARNLQRT